MKSLYEMVNTKITLHEYETLVKFMENMNLSQCMQMKEEMISELNTEITKKMKKGMYEEDILNQLYGNQ